MKKIFFFVLFTIIFCSSCVNTTPQDVEDETYYNVKFYDGQAIISDLSVTSLNELIYPSMQDKLVGSDIYRFVGWDINNDNAADAIEVLNQDLNLYAIYQKIDSIDEDKEYTITYHISNTETKKAVFEPGIVLELPTVSDTERFYYYEDEAGKVYTDQLGSILSYIRCNQDIELFPKIIHNGDDLQSLSLYTYPKSVVCNEELEELEAAIEAEDVAYIDEDTLSYRGQLFEKRVAISDGNIFHNLTRIEHGKTYYFKYEPLEFDVIHAQISATQVRLSLVTKDVIDSISSSCVRVLSTWAEYVYYYVASKPSAIIEDFFASDNIQIDSRYFPFSLNYECREGVIPSAEDIITKEKYASDYVMATTLLDIGYEIDNMFKVNFLTADLVNPLAMNDSAYIYDNKSKLTTDKLVNEHGLLLQYNITIEEA